MNVVLYSKVVQKFLVFALVFVLAAAFCCALPKSFEDKRRWRRVLSRLDNLKPKLSISASTDWITIQFVDNLNFLLKFG